MKASLIFLIQMYPVQGTNDKVLTLLFFHKVDLKHLHKLLVVSQDSWRYIFGDEERYLLDRWKELNRFLDKETRIRFLKREVQKRGDLLKKRSRRAKVSLLQIFCYCIGMVYFRQRRKKAAKDQVAAAHLKLDELEFSDFNTSADEFEEEEDIYKKDKSSSTLDIVSADIDNDIHSETDWDEDIEEDEMETGSLLGTYLCKL